MAITSNNVQNVKFLRNGSLFESRTAAQTGMEAQLNSLADGTAILGRYSGTTTGDTSTTYYKTLVGFVFNDGTNKSLTIFDVEGASADVEALRQEINAKLGNGISSNNTATAQLTALSGTSTVSSADTSVWGAKIYASSYTESIIDGLDYTLSADDNKVVDSFQQTDGKISGTSKNITSVKLAGYAVGSDAKIAATDTLGEALGKLQGQINGMGLTDTAVEGNYVSKVNEVDGKITVTRVALPTVGAISSTGKPITAVSESLGTISATAGTIEAQYVTTSTANTDFTGETVQAALEEISSKVKADKITSADKTIPVTTGATGTDVAVNIDGTTLIKNSSTGVISSDLKIKSINQASSSSYASQYQLVYGSSETPIGDVISVGKDQFLKEASYDATTQKLTLVMYNSTGGTTNIDVDFSAAVIEAEAGEGLYVKEDHSLNVGIASSSETVTISDGQGGSTQAAVLSVNADNIEVQNIQNAIDYKVSTLDATVGSQTVASGKHVAVEVSEADGKLTAVTVTEHDIANATDLSALSAKTVTAVEMTGGTAAIAANSSDGTKKITINADGASVKATGYSKGSDGSAIAAADTINAALSKLENQVDNAKAAATTEIAEGTDAGNNMSIVETTGASGQKIYTISLSDVASKTALDNEISYRKAIDGINGDAYTANTSNYISNATSLNDADVKLDAQVKTNADDILKNKVKAGNGIDVTGGSSTTDGTTVSVKLDTTTYTGGNALVVDSNGLRITTIDCGEY